MRSVYLAIADLARRFFARTGIPMPGFARRANRVLRRNLAPPTQRDLREEIEALARAVERLETRAYLDDIGHRPE